MARARSDHPEEERDPHGAPERGAEQESVLDVPHPHPGRVRPTAREEEEEPDAPSAAASHSTDGSIAVIAASTARPSLGRRRGSGRSGTADRWR